MNLRAKNRELANFSKLGVQTDESVVTIDESKVGKGDFIRALQFILDPTHEAKTLEGLEAKRRSNLFGFSL